MPNDIKKSLLVTFDFPPNIGGVATYYYNVCKNLPSNKIVVLAPEQDGDKNFDQQQKFPVLREFTTIRKKIIRNFPEKWPKGIGGIFKIASSVKWMSLIKYFYKIAKTHNIEIIQVGQVLPIGTLALFYKKRKKIPYIFYAHGLDILLPQKFMRKKTLLKNIVKEAKKIIANSHFTKDELIKLGAKPEQVEVIYPCPNLEPEQASEWKIQEIIERQELNNKKIILTVGRLVERKGHDMIIESLPKILKEVPNTIYLIVGKGPYEDKLKTLVNQKKLGEYVKFIGAVSQNDLAAYYQICDVFTMPARQLENGDVEGFGIVYLEANLYGKPVIGGRSGGVPEAVINEKTGLLVNPNNPDDIARATIKLLTDPAYAAKLGTQGMQRVLDEFDWPTQVEKIKKILV